VPRNQPGNLYLWCYPELNASPGTPRSLEGWHLTADSAACAQLSRVLDELSTGTRAGPETFAVSPTPRSVWAVPHAGAGPAARSVRELRIVKAPNPRHFSIEERDAVLTITAGRERLDEVREHVAVIPDGEGDDSIGPDEDAPPDQELWFWWLVQ